MGKRGQSAAKFLNENINKTFGVLTLISYSHYTNTRYFYNCTCNRCGENTRVRTDHILKNPKSCGNCVKTLQKEIADSKYLKLRKYRKIYNSYKGNANTRNMLFKLNFNEVKKLVDDKCYYCHDSNSLGIDRLDSNDYYHIDNVVSCCRICNFMKNNFDKELFFSKIRDIYNIHLKESSTTSA